MYIDETRGRYVGVGERMEMGSERMEMGIEGIVVKGRARMHGHAYARKCIHTVRS